MLLTMKIAMKQLVLFCALCLQIFATSAWAETRPTLTSAVALNKSNPSGFNAQLIIAPGDGQHLRKTWTGKAHAQTTQSVSQGSALSTLIVFSGCATNAKGLCDVIAEFFIVSPDGVKKSGGRGTVWSEAPVSIEGVSVLGQASLTAGFDKTDPIGEYKVLVNVTDNVSGKTLNLSNKFKLTK
jgi:hypothetical protein